MDVLDRITADGSALLTVVISTIGAYVLVVVLTRLLGPRSLAKMSTFDWVATVAMGSMLASTAVGAVSLAEGATGLVVLFLSQALVALLRRRGSLARLVDNQPLLLMAGPVVLEENLRSARINREELFGQLRVGGVRQLAQVRAVVLESSGTLSVLTGDGPVDQELLAGVRGAERLP